ncbi:MAG: YqjF family protein [Pyrinomonadaceae bacterium]
MRAVTASATNAKPAPFLTAEWRYLVMLNYEIDPGILRPLIPAGTELDYWRGRALVSVVGFRFLNTCLLRFRLPFHQHFDEINLRFYVRRRHGNEWRRAVVFIKEVVPKHAIATVARIVYNEPYVALPMRHNIEMDRALVGEPGLARYQWKQSRWYTLEAATLGMPVLVQPESQEDFITEHYWGYTTQRDGNCLEYAIAHPRWRVWQTGANRFDCDIEQMYGRQYCDALDAPPSSAFVAEGSSVAVYRGVRLPG